MKVIDANVLLYAVNEDDERHERSRDWLDAALGGQEALGFTWVVLLAFLRLSTKVGLFPRPLSVADACTTITDWLDAAPSVVLEPTARHATVLSGLLADVGTGGNLVSDAHLAARARAPRHRRDLRRRLWTLPGRELAPPVRHLTKVPP